MRVFYQQKLRTMFWLKLAKTKKQFFTFKAIDKDAMVEARIDLYQRI